MRVDSERLNTEIYDIVARIPYGYVCTYGLLARLAGFPQHARMVGRAMASAPAILGLPCHRVVNSHGGLVTHWPEQRRLLEAEGIIIKKNGCVDLGRYLWNLL